MQFSSCFAQGMLACNRKSKQLLPSCLCFRTKLNPFSSRFSSQTFESHISKFYWTRAWKVATSALLFMCSMTRVSVSLRQIWRHLQCSDNFQSFKFLIQIMNAMMASELLFFKMTQYSISLFIPCDTQDSWQTVTE